MGLATQVAVAERAIDGLVPSRVERPDSVEALASLIGAAHHERAALVLWGGGTRIGVGDPPERYDAAVDLTALRGIVEHSPADLVCTVRAGTTLAELARALAASGQRWPVDGPSPTIATVGGTVAGAAVGPARLRYQHPRDWILGCTAVLGDGTITHAGGRVVKNVTGYDLTRLYSGSYGTLVALAEITLKLVAAPEQERTLQASTTDAPAALRLAAQLRATHVPLDALAIATGRAAEAVGERGTRLLIRIAGDRAAVARIARAVRELTAMTEAVSPWDALADATASSSSTARAVWPAGHQPPGQLDLSDAVIYPGSGIAFMLQDLTAEKFVRARTALEGADGALIVERGTADFKRAVGGAWGRPRVPLAIARALKERFDPHGVLAPGRVPLAPVT